MRRILAIAVALFGVFGVAQAAFAEKRVALVIGNAAYRGTTPLVNPKNDAEDVAAALKRVGFETILGLDLDQAAMQSAAIRFARAARESDIAMFYYAGHAMQFNGVNYLLPVDVKLTDEASPSSRSEASRPCGRISCSALIAAAKALGILRAGVPEDHWCFEDRGLVTQRLIDALDLAPGQYHRA